MVVKWNPGWGVHYPYDDDDDHCSRVVADEMELAHEKGLPVVEDEMAQPPGDDRMQPVDEKAQPVDETALAVDSDAPVDSTSVHCVGNSGRRVCGHGLGEHGSQPRRRRHLRRSESVV